MNRVPLLSGSRLAVVRAPESSPILRPPPPGEAIADVGAAVRDALRFPLTGEPLQALAARGRRATIVVEPPALPIPGAQVDPRQAAIAAVADELERAGISFGRQTILVAGGLARRTRRRELRTLVSHEFARRFRGLVEVHDAEQPDLVEIGRLGGVPLRVNPALVETDVVVVVTAAETVLHGGPAALLAAASPHAPRHAGAESLFETSSSSGWQLALALERALGERVPLIGASLTLNHPTLSPALRGYPYDPGADERIAGSPLRPAFDLLPSAARALVLGTLGRELSAAAAFAGPPSVAHAEALLRGIRLRSATLEGRLDAICIGIPRTTPHLPRERPNPLLAAYLGLGLALRLWRDAFPLVEGGTAILLSRFVRHFSHPTQQPYRAFFGPGSRSGPDPGELIVAERAAAEDERGLAEYRAGSACHPLLPFAEWEACLATLSRLGAVIVAGCRDAVAARALGFVPSHGIGPALEMARGRAGGPPRVGFLLAPPYFPLTVRP